MVSTKLLYLLGLRAVTAFRALPPPPKLNTSRRLGYVMDDTTIRTAVTEWLDNAAAAEANYGHISTWDTGGVTDMSYLFNGRPDLEQYKAGAQYFNENISAWQTSGVTNMRSMFTYAYAFDQPIGGWNVGLVTSMRDMFQMAIVFNQPLNGWDVANVKDMWYMFGFARVFNQPLGDWNVGSVTLIRDMFNGAWAFNQALDSWDLSAVWHMGWMFWEAYSFDQVLGWCVDNGVYMDSAFGSTACESTACGVVQGGCTQAPTTNWGTGNGWCMSDLDEYVGDASTASACWTMCEDRYGSDLVAIDWSPVGDCYCQDDCQCMEDAENGDIHLITSSDVAALPNECASVCPAEEAAFEDCLSNQNSLDDDCGGGGDYFLATGGESCDDACASAGGCDLAATTAAASSLETCKSILDDLGVSYGMSTGPGTSVDSSGCTYHPGQSGWAQLFGNPTCGTVDPDVSRQRVCACNCGTPGGDGDDDDDDDDDFSPNTCADVQQWLSDGLCQDGPAVCQTEYQAYVECTYEYAAQGFLGLTCDFACARDCPADSFDNLETCEDCDALDGDCADCECRDFDQVVEANCKAACALTTPQPTSAPSVSGAITLSGITVEDAEANKAVLQDAIARVAGVETEAVTIQSVASARRRLQASVIVDYKIEADDFAAAEEASEKLQDAADDTSIIEAEIESSAAAIGKEKVFMNVKIEELSVAVVTTEAPTAAPTTYWDNKKKRKDDATLLILVIVCCVAVFCCLLAISTAIIYTFGGCFCFAKRKTRRVAEPSEPPLAHATVMSEAPPAMSPGTLAKTQEHIRRTAALMAEAPPSPPGPPPLAPIKATETLPAEMP